jgi:DNA modification methylase
LRTKRHSYGIELNSDYASLAGEALIRERQALGQEFERVKCEVVRGDAANLADIINKLGIPLIDYVLTSPPYWNMLHVRGAQTQKNRRNSENMDVVYSAEPNDLGNISDYDEFISRLTDIYAALSPYLRGGAYMTIIVKNIKKGGRIYPLAWDLANKLSRFYSLKDEKIWCQDNQRLSPYGLGNAWVSNTFHHYCLQFRKT